MTSRPAKNMTLFPLDDVGGKQKKANAKSKKPTPKRSAAHVEVEAQLRRTLGTKVVLVDKGGKGTITVVWHGYDHLDALLAKFGR